MSPRFQRFVFTLLGVALIFPGPGCHTNKVVKLDVPAVTEPGKEHVVGVTLKNGSEVKFDPPGATVADGLITAKVKTTPYTVAIADVQRLWVERKELSAVRTVGLTAGSVLGAIGTAILLKGSCPFVYSWDGTRYVFDAEPYGGAITRGLERDDYAELKHLKPKNGVYHLLLTNEVDETQYTDVLELLVVDHPHGLRVVADETGQLFGYSEILTPRSATDRYGSDLMPWLKASDHKIWEPEAVVGPDGSLRQEIVLTFPKPPGAKQANLIADASTGLWGSYMIKKTIELRGREAGVFFAALDNNPAVVKAVHAWGEREETYRLRIEVEEPTGWQFRGTMLGSGPYIATERVIPLDVSRVPGDTVSVRFRPPVGFWAFNSFALAYGAGQPVSSETVAIRSAKTSDRNDVTALLSSTDGQYYRMPDMIQKAELTFPAPAEKPGQDRTVFLHTRGWYELHLKSEGPPDEATLSKISSIPGAIAQFAVDQYTEWKMHPVIGSSLSQSSGTTPP